MKILSSNLIGLFVALSLELPSTTCLAQRPELPQGDPARTWTDADSVDGRWNDTDVGPFLASVINTPGGKVAKGLSIKVGEKQDATVCYDTANCTMRCAWTGGFLKFSDRRYGMTSAPAIRGDVFFSVAGDAWHDQPVRYRGLFQQGRRVVLRYQVGEMQVNESPWMTVTKEGLSIVTRALLTDPHKQEYRMRIASTSDKMKSIRGEDFQGFQIDEGDQVTVIAVAGRPQDWRLAVDGGAIELIFMPRSSPRAVEILIWKGAQEQRKQFDAWASTHDAGDPVPKLSSAGQPLWPQWIATGGRRGEGDGAYAIDSVNVPFDNPYKALMFTSGLDFLSNGDIAVSTLHGDVWLVRGVDDDLSDVKWKRFATGLHQPLGLKVVDDKIYVLGKDQITRLHDRNGDDEADFYECFNNAGQTSLGGHDYAACLETDPKGNFYYIRAHEGVCRVSADGKEHESIATGFRNPIGLGVSPTGLVTAAPQEGNWTPSSAIFAVKRGGYYGFGGPKKDNARPLGYDAPLCWMPRSQDNSSGGQVWVTSDKWGLPRDAMLHLSYGLCTALIVLPESIDGTYQGGTVKLPSFFESGVCRGRFHPRDGQLYVCGLMGWQTAAAKDGCLQRVRYTGKPVHMPVGLKVETGGIAITFNQPLDPKSAGNPDNYYIEQWNYRYAKEYGSKEYRTTEPNKFGRDEVFIDDARLSNNNRTVHLQLEEISPVMQMGVTYNIEAADGAKLKETIYNTINIVPK